MTKYSSDRRVSVRQVIRGFAGYHNLKLDEVAKLIGVPRRSLFNVMSSDLSLGDARPLASAASKRKIWDWCQLNFEQVSNPNNHQAKEQDNV